MLPRMWVRVARTTSGTGLRDSNTADQRSDLYYLGMPRR